ncbi:MAG: CDP-alcohol phosphatidyltransferase family protein [candidate division KSB1 bacterium]|nr:CDP-alcohol phosphatidyltransferase family protein [candidate division KSB1 bacterium]
MRNQKIKILPDVLKSGYLSLIAPVVNFFVKLNPNPNWFTTFGLLLSIVSAYFFAVGRLKLGGLFIILSGTFDIIDGKVARHTGQVTKFGALYDSTMDRYAEVIVFFGLVYYFGRQKWFLYGIDLGLVASVAVSIALGGSIMVSYIRARAEGLGFECKIGLMQRPERIAYLATGAIVHKYALVVAVFLIAILANFTAFQRLYYIRKLEKEQKKKPV